MFTDPELFACKRLVDLALAEDLAPPQAAPVVPECRPELLAGDITSCAVIPPDLEGQAIYLARKPGTLAGLPAALVVCRAVDPRLQLQMYLQDGAKLSPRDRIATVRGPMRSLLAAERTSLNFLQRLSGVATVTRQYVDAVLGLPCKILDTRKTTPGWRLLEKYAVRQGGGHNHRIGLYDGILIKDNHLAALKETGRQGDKETGRQGEGAVAEAVRMARAKYGHDYPLEIEVDRLEMLDEALLCNPDIVLLDNMTTDQMREAVNRRNRMAPKVQLEASGGITFARLREIAETGVDRISVGALTHSAPALDIALDYLS